MIGELKVRGFLTIKNADLLVSKLTVIIGPQANGKSLLAKLVYYFKAISSDFLEGVREQSGKRDLDARLVERFESYFPRYTWEGTSFDIEYSLGDLIIRINGDALGKGKTRVKISYCESLVNFYRARKAAYKKKLEDLDIEDGEYVSYKSIATQRALFREFVHYPASESGFSEFFRDAAFIPASRSFFANLQKNIFTFLASNIEIDPFLKEFGSLYEYSKAYYRSRSYKGASPKNKNSFRNEEYISEIILGMYEYREEKDWIVNKNRRVNLANASSGQQEALPMLLAMLVWPMHKRSAGTLFVEEPEAHLFPTAQAKIVSIISLLNVRQFTNFFITTHSPYVLSAINNLIMAYDAVSEGRVDKNDFQRKFDLGEPLKFDEVSAYTIEDGLLVSIKDDEYRIIGAELLDSVASKFDEATSYLLDR